MFYLQSAGDVTLVTHLTASRWSQLTRTLHYWEGPVSAAVYYTQEERLQLTQSISQAEHYHHRLTVHLIEDSGVSFKKYIVTCQGRGVSIKSHRPSTDKTICALQPVKRWTILKLDSTSNKGLTY